MKDHVKGAILLCGVPGCGKTETGRLLANLLNIPFIDLDESVANRAGRSIPEVFSGDGEDKFRELENEILGDLLSGENPVVISLGGGTLEAKGIRETISLNSALTVWLKVTPPEAAERLEEGGLVDERPLLKNLRGNELRLKLEQLLEQRVGGYSLSDISIDTDGLSGKQVAMQIAEVIDSL